MVLRLARKALFSPVWVLWKLYNGLWWTFADDAPAKPEPSHLGEKTRAAAQGAAFEVVDSNERVIVPDTRPVGTLKWGFATTLAASALSGWACHAAFVDEALRSSTAVSLWAWITAVTAVGSIWAVKKIARRQAEQRARGWRGHARAAAAGFADMGKSAYGAAVTTKHAAMTAGQRAAQAYRASREAARKVGGRLRTSS
jgi:hypothetical protein